MIQVLKEVNTFAIDVVDNQVKQPIKIRDADDYQTNKRSELGLVKRSDQYIAYGLEIVNYHAQPHYDQDYISVEDVLVLPEVAFILSV